MKTKPSVTPMDERLSQTRERLKRSLDGPDGRWLVDHLQRVFGDAPTQQAPISGDQMRGRLEVIQYLIKHGELVAPRDDG